MCPIIPTATLCLIKSFLANLSIRCSVHVNGKVGKIVERLENVWAQLTECADNLKNKPLIGFSFYTNGLKMVLKVLEEEEGVMVTILGVMV